MSIKHIPVQWNPIKWRYDIIMLAGVFLYLVGYIWFGPRTQDLDGNINFQVHYARAFGSCAFFMLTLILCIGPLARLDTRFLPLLYNRRHFGVMTLFVALTHAGYILNWYFAFSSSSKYETLLFANTSYGSLLGFPFEMFGIFALLCLAILASTSHDFWMKFLRPPLWKKFHFLIYPAYAALVAHVGLGILQDQQNHTFSAFFVAGALAVVVLHLVAYAKERAFPASESADSYTRVCRLDEMENGFGKVGLLPNGERVAVFLYDNKISAVSNVCAHQNGPLGEGKILRCLVTCPWHGFQYNVADGRSPAPFTELIPTYNIELRDNEIWVDANANPPGTYVEPIIVGEEASDG